jgi:hypothetical protein
VLDVVEGRDLAIQKTTVGIRTFDDLDPVDAFIQNPHQLPDIYFARAWHHHKTGQCIFQLPDGIGQSQIRLNTVLAKENHNFRLKFIGW